VTVVIDRIHRSYLMHITDGWSHATVFQPGVPGATLASEEQATRLILDTGLPIGTVAVHRTWSERDVEITGSPADDTELDRSVSTVWAPVDGADGDPIVELLVDAHRSELGEAAPVRAETLVPVLRSLEAAPTVVTLVRALAVDEHWRSPYGRAARRYLVAPRRPVDPRLLEGRAFLTPEAPVRPVLDDGTLAAGPVSVDSRGHLYEPATRMDCPVCRGVYGSCCGDDATIDSCPACGRPACRGCRQARHEHVAPASCERCGDASCHACTRHLIVVACDLCTRTVCAGCLDGPRCLTCASLVPATSADVTALPTELAATGMSVLIAHDGTATVVVLTDGARAEVALVTDGAVTRWKSAGSEPTETLGIRLAAARLAGTGRVALRSGRSGAAVRAPFGLILESASGDEVHWTVEVDGTRVTGSAVGPKPGDPRQPIDPDVLAEVGRALSRTQLTEPVPESVTGRRAALVRRIAGSIATGAVATAPTRRPVATLVAGRQPVSSAVVVDGRGLVRWSAVAEETSESVAEWHAPDVVPPWALRDWVPAPSVPVIAVAGPWTAVVAVVGSFSALGVHHDNGSEQWYSISGDESELVRGVIGQALCGRPAILSVGRLTTPSHISSPVIHGCQWMARRVAPELSASSYLTTDEAPLHEAHQTFAGRIAPRAPRRAALSTATASALRRWADNVAVERLHRDIGLRVEEDWRTTTGEIVTVRYTVRAGFAEGYLTDEVDGRALRGAVLCRSRHVVASVSWCLSCREPTCGACVDHVSPCALCGGAFCGRCTVTNDGRCAACSDLRKLSMLARRRIGAGWTADAWQGTGPASVTTVTRSDGGWSVSRAEGERWIPVPVDPERRRLLETCLR
jgi:hypothetical protein